MRRSTVFSVGVLVFAMTCANAVRAGIVVYTDENAFRSVAGSPAFVSFESYQLAEGQDQDALGTSTFFSRDDGGLGGFGIGPIDAGVERLTIFRNLNFAAHGEKSVGGEVTGIQFFLFEPTPLRAFGFTIYDFGNAGVPDTLRLILDDTIVDLATTDGLSPGGQFRFFGVTSDVAFTSVRIQKSVAEDFITVDSVLYSTTVIPEPSTLVMGGIAGFTGLGFAWLRWRRRAAPANQRLGTPTLRS